MFYLFAVPYISVTLEITKFNVKLSMAVLTSQMLANNPTPSA